MPITLNDELRQLEIETFEIEEIEDGGDALAATSCSCSCSSCCSCSTSSCCSCSTSCSSCG